MYFGGIDKWNNEVGYGDSLSPVSLGDSTAQQAMVACTQIRISGTFGGTAGHNGVAYEDIPAHGSDGSSDNAPLGGNHVYGDGSGSWVTWNTEWRKLHTWRTGGSRDLFWYQEDLGDFETEAALLP